MPIRDISPAKGFTLVEMVVAIAIAGIVAGMVAMFIRMPVLAYVDTAARAELTDTADTALRRIARDVRLALPNSIRRTTDGNQVVYLEFLPTKTGGRYLADDDNATTGNILSFTDAAKTSFDLVGPVPIEAQAIATGDYVVVYNLGPLLNPANAYDCAGSCNRAEFDSIAGVTITLKSNPFASQAEPKFTSPGNHFHVIAPSPVTYVCNPAAGTLTRISGYTIQASQPDNIAASPLSGASKALLASGVTACEFSYDNAAGSMVSQRSGLVGLGLTLQSKNGNGTSVSLFQQVHVDNTP
ncbi:prepilin-type N-terminal cleavage/methylation domain-containing protein [Noviherbaspirillum cavernae]|nr:prepilin-type N-terminal cleavage/methylation domain-containing protein [Noviherbaspirillum cavernae]